MASKKTLEHYLRQMRLIEEHREKWAEQNIRRHYKDLMTDLQEFLGVEYAKLAQDDKLTYEILHGKGQYARFIEEVERRINKFSPKAAQEIRDTVQLTYQKCFEGMVDAVMNSNTYEELKLNLKGLRAVTPDIIKNAVSNSYMEKALEKNHKSTIYDIKQQIGIGLSQGDRMSTMARRISDQLGKNYRRSVMIARTECHRVREAGYQDSSERIYQKLQDSDSDYVMVKIWKTMEDMAVRPYRIKGKKGQKTFVKGKGPDHTKMQGVMVLVDEKFDLGDGVMAITPGQSGVAGHDINCRCYTSKDLMTKAEYEKVSGKKVPVADPAKAYEHKEQLLLDNQTELEKQKDKLEQRKANLETYEYEGIWKDTVTVKDYEAKKDRIDAKLAYYEENIYDAKNRMGKFANTTIYSDKRLETIIKSNEEFIEKLKNFEAQGKAYQKIIGELADIDKKFIDNADQLKAVRQKIMKIKGIDVDAMQLEIDDLISEINALKKASTATPAPAKPVKKLNLHSNTQEFTEEQIIEAHKKAFGYEPSLYDIEFYNYTDVPISTWIDDIFIIKSEKTQFENALEKVVKSSGKTAGKKLTLKSKISEFTEDQLNEAFENSYGFNPGKAHFTSLENETMEWYIKNILPHGNKTKFKQELAKAVKGASKTLSEADLKKLEALENALAKKQDELAKIRKRYGLEDDTFSQARKDAAYWFTDKNGGASAADKVYRQKAGEIWRKATRAQKDSAYEYTRSYHKYNEPLRGFEYGTNKFLGVGNVDLNEIGVNGYGGFQRGEVKKLIDDLTDYIDRGGYDFDMWLNRGCRRAGMDKFFNVDPSDFDLSEKELAAKLIGTTPTEYGFMSTGVARGTGFGGEIKLNIYAPKGTKMAYVEPFSAFGDGAGKNWDGITTQSSIGYEAEMLLQRNTTFKVIKVEKSGSQWYIDLEVIGQER